MKWISTRILIKFVGFFKDIYVWASFLIKSGQNQLNSVKGLSVVFEAVIQIIAILSGILISFFNLNGILDIATLENRALFGWQSLEETLFH